ncbi:hypothetical protein KM043_010932 [Ampulex compressa]|nr:hypothetical protein KM043_010932 [Ampulex compressa]
MKFLPSTLERIVRVPALIPVHDLRRAQDTLCVHARRSADEWRPAGGDADDTGPATENNAVTLRRGSIMGTSQRRCAGRRRLGEAIWARVNVIALIFVH